jgi:mRNA interferase RelE/StbE
MLRIEVGNRVAKFQARLPPKHRRQIAERIILLASAPDAPDTKALHGSPYRRADSGEYRIVYEVAGGVLRVVLVGKRNDDEVYRALARLGR